MPYLDYSRNYGITPTRVGALFLGLSQQRRSVTSLDQVQTFFTGSCATMSSLAPVSFVSLAYTALNSIHYGITLIYLSGEIIIYNIAECISGADC